MPSGGKLGEYCPSEIIAPISRTERTSIPTRGGSLAASWFVSRKNKKFGPVQWSEVQTMAQRGEILPTDTLWTEGLIQWAPATSFSGLISGGGAVYSGSPVHRQPSAYAGFWIRVAAYFLDYFLLGFAEVLILRAVFNFSFMPDRHGHFQEVPPMFTLATIFLPIVYFVAMESSKCQATLGKMILGLKVTDLSGERISFNRAIGRYFGKFVSALILCFGFIMCAISPRGQCLHDLMARCLVVRNA
ncbi:MAG TPA: RDD family protein [Tepidisphaeraceae bacterium]|nr:RDD family protein [Tepidisphaeraceae bacterium]